jgi:hypothetical protein
MSSDYIIQDPVANVSYAHEPVVGYILCNYTSINLGTGYRTSRQLWTNNKTSALTLINYWNKVLPKAWKYELE